MDIQGIKEYLTIAIDAIQNLEIQKQTINKYQNQVHFFDSQINSVNNQIQELQNNPPIPPVKPVIDEWTSADSFGAALTSIGLGFVISLIPGAIIGWIFSFDVTAVFLGIVCIIIYILHRISFSLDQDKKKEDYKRAYEYYKKSIDEHDKLLTQKQVDLYYFSLKKKYLSDTLAHFQNILSNEEEYCSKVRSQGIIHRKYLDNPMHLALIYDYLDTGICDSLEGPNGAYYKLELDSRLDNISYQLNDIMKLIKYTGSILININKSIDKMDKSVNDIDDHLNSMDSSFKKISQTADSLDKKVQKMKDSMNRIEESTSLSDYQHERIAREIEYLNRINYLKDHGEDLSSSSYRPPHM